MENINDKNLNNCFERLQPLGAQKDVPMKKHTSFKIGGNADVLFVPKSVRELLLALNCAKELSVPVFVMGNGSNLLVSDNGIRGLVIKLRDKDCDISFDAVNMKMTVSAATLFSVAVKKSVEAGYMGLEWGAGIPGTVGGAVAMNAGAYGGEIRDVIDSLRIITCESGEYVIKDEYVHEGDMGYRYSRFAYPQAIVLSATFNLQKDDGSARIKMEEYTQRRTQKQPLSYPSAGSVFKRPQGYFAGALIEEAGLKGASCGDAQVSELHAGFIINKGDATAQNVLDLIERIKKEVYENSGVMLCEELKLIGG